MELAVSSVTLFLGGGIVLLAGLTIARYMRMWRKTSGSTSLLPLHVWLVAGSYLLLVVLVLVGGISGQLNLIDWRAAIRIPALALGLSAMFVLYNFQRKTYGNGNGKGASDEDPGAGDSSSGDRSGEV